MVNVLLSVRTKVEPYLPNAATSKGSRGGKRRGRLIQIKAPGRQKPVITRKREKRIGGSGNRLGGFWSEFVNWEGDRGKGEDALGSGG